MPFKCMRPGGVPPTPTPSFHTHSHTTKLAAIDQTKAVRKRQSWCVPTLLVYSFTRKATKGRATVRLGGQWGHLNVHLRPRRPHPQVNFTSRLSNCIGFQRVLHVRLCSIRASVESAENIHILCSLQGPSGASGPQTPKAQMSPRGCSKDHQGGAHRVRLQ